MIVMISDGGHHSDGHHREEGSLQHGASQTHPQLQVQGEAGKEVGSQPNACVCVCTRVCVCVCVCVCVRAAGLSSLLVRVAELALRGRFSCCGSKVFICNVPLSGSLKRGIVAFMRLWEYCRIS